MRIMAKIMASNIIVCGEMGTGWFGVPKKCVFIQVFPENLKKFWSGMASFNDFLGLGTLIL